VRENLPIQQDFVVYSVFLCTGSYGSRLSCWLYGWLRCRLNCGLNCRLDRWLFDWLVYD